MLITSLLEGEAGTQAQGSGFHLLLTLSQMLSFLLPISQGIQKVRGVPLKQIWVPSEIIS